MTQRELECLRQRLISAHGELVKELRKTCDLLKEHSEGPDDFESVVDMEISVSTLNNEYETTKAIEAALERMADGSYGVCDSCSEPISFRRLTALPWAGLCISCQTLAEESKPTTRGASQTNGHQGRLARGLSTNEETRQQTVTRVANNGKR